MRISTNAKTERIGVQIVGEKFERYGYIFREQPISDYGIDAHIEVVKGDIVTGQLIAVQIKSGSSWFKEEGDDCYVYRGDKKHLDYWLEHSLPVIVVLCDISGSRCYWQAITPSNIIPTEKAWKINVPKLQLINPGMNIDIERLVNKLPVYKSYTVVSTGDVSLGAAKRYSLRIILNREHTQAEILDVIKSATFEAINCECHRNEINRKYWRKTPAHVVWLLIYPSAEDEKNNNYICRSEWFSEILNPKFLPVSNGGEEIYPNLRVDWNNNYLTWSKTQASNTSTKESFICRVTSLTNQTMPLVHQAVKTLDQYEKYEIDFSYLTRILTKNFKKIDKLYMNGINMGLASYECKDLSTKFQLIIAHAHNVYLPFSGIGKGFGLEQTIFNIKSQAKYYYEIIKEFNSELKKAQ